MASINVPVAGPKKKRYGLFKVRPGSDHVIRCPDGQARQFKVGERRHLKEGATLLCYCKYCKKDWPTEQDLLAAHPDQVVMIKQEEDHAYVWKEVKEPTAGAGKSGAVATIVALFSDDEEQ